MSQSAAERVYWAIADLPLLPDKEKPPLLQELSSQSLITSFPMWCGLATND